MAKKGYDVSKPIEIVTLSDDKLAITQGHHRTRAAIAAELDKVPVIEAHPWNYPFIADTGRIISKEEVEFAAKEMAKTNGRKW